MNRGKGKNLNSVKNCTVLDNFVFSINDFSELFFKKSKLELMIAVIHLASSYL